MEQSATRTKLSDLMVRVENERRERMVRALQLAIDPRLKISQWRSPLIFNKFPLFATTPGFFGTIRYQTQDLKYWVEVTGNTEYGMATQRDASILRWAVSKAREIFFKAGVVPQGVAFTRYQLLKALGKDDKKQNYTWLDNALKRLASTCYRGNIFCSDEALHQLGTLCSFVYDIDDDGHVAGVSLQFSSLFYGVIAQEKGVIAIADEVMKEPSNLRIRLLELVNSQLYNKTRWPIGLSTLAAACGYQGELKELKRTITKLTLPFSVEFSRGRSVNSLVTFGVPTGLPYTPKH